MSIEKIERTDYIAEAVTEAFGERCPDFAEGCACCEAWQQYDLLGEERDDAIATVKLLQSQHKRQMEHDGALLEKARDALEHSLKLAMLAENLTGCRADDDFAWDVQVKIEAALDALSEREGQE